MSRSYAPPILLRGHKELHDIQWPFCSWRQHFVGPVVSCFAVRSVRLSFSCPLFSAYWWYFFVPAFSVDRCRTGWWCFACSADHCRPPPLVRNAVAKLNQTDRSVSISCMTGCRFPDGLAVKTFYCSADGSWDYDLPQCDGMHRVFVQLFRYRQRKISIISTHLVVTILLTSAGSNGCSASSICTSFIPYDVRPLLNLNGLQCRLPPPHKKTRWRGLRVPPTYAVAAQR